MKMSLAHIGILGLGLSGEAALRALSAQGYPVTAWDDDADKRTTIYDQAAVKPLTGEILKTLETLVAAPGIADTHPVLREARDYGIEVICDIELWHRMHPSAHVVAITGTNGKSTLTAMVSHALNTLGRKADMAGNIGVPIFDLPLPFPEERVCVLECSSFQIERCPTFRPSIAALTNITPDHLDRHGTMETYAKIKAHLFEGKGKAVIAQTDDWTRLITHDLQALGLREVEAVIPCESVDLTNTKMARVILSHLGVGISTAEAEKALQTYIPLPHRQALVTKRAGVSYIDDSKATNAEAAIAALTRFEEIIWIVGGVPKAGGLEAIAPYLHHVRHACVIGDKMSPFTQWLKAHHIPFTPCGRVEKAVIEAEKQARSCKAKTVLLSPACASYDQYPHFMARGQAFAQAVQGLSKREEQA